MSDESKTATEEMTEEQIHDLSGEDLDKAIRGEDLSADKDSSTETDSADEKSSTDKTEEADTKQDDSAKTDMSTETKATEELSTEKEVPDWVPDKYRKHYKEGNLEDILKSAMHFEKQVLNLRKSKPGDDVKEDEGKLKEAEKVTDDLQSVVNQMRKDGYEEDYIKPIEAMIKGFEKRIDSVKNELLSFNQEQIQDYVKDNLEKEVNKFSESIKEFSPFENEADFYNFLGEVPQYVLPTGGKKNARFFTADDLESAFFRKYKNHVFNSIGERAKTKILQDIKSAENLSDTSVSASDVHTDSKINDVAKRLENAKTQEEFEKIAKSLTKEELDEAMEKRGILPKLKVRFT
jgi:hypothetical protein